MNTNKSGSHRRSAKVESNQAAKRQTLLDGAVGLFNAQGISGTSIAQVAKTLGLARASVYHYVQDRSDLVFQCYQRSCAITAADLKLADNSDTGLQKTFDYIRLALTPDRKPIAVLSEISSMGDAHRAVIHRANNRNLKKLTGFLSAGLQDGSVRDSDPELVAQAIVGMLSWAQLLPHWSMRPNAQQLRQRAQDAIIFMLDEGLATDPNFVLHCSVRAEDFLPVLTNAFDRKEAAAVKMDLMLSRASKMFNRFGIEGTSIDLITESLGVTKGAVYHHLKDKRDLVQKCYERSFDLYDRFASAAANQGENGLASSLINSHLNIQAQVGLVSPLMPQPGFEAVPKRKRTIFKARAAKENQNIATLLAKGIQQGAAKPCDTRLTTHICAGAFGWLPKWLPEQRQNEGVAIADEICRMMAHGLAAR